LIFFFLFLSSYFPRLFDFFAVEEKLGKRKAPIRVDRRCWLVGLGSVGWWCAVASPLGGRVVWMAGFAAGSGDVLACRVSHDLLVGLQLLVQAEEGIAAGFRGQVVDVSYSSSLGDQFGGVGLQGVVAAGHYDSRICSRISNSASDNSSVRSWTMLRASMRGSSLVVISAH
jgi:hypothetical protein